uniref:J domain-containing protein n=2 Tax=Auxenochlorella protothecoides TaxID=3075 RepID=A0A1D2AEP5_AUXPR
MDPYAALGVKPGASKDDIKAAFRRAAMKCHPDMFAQSGAQAQERAAANFKALTEAYNALMQGGRRPGSGGRPPPRGQTPNYGGWASRGGSSARYRPPPPRSFDPIAAWYRLTRGFSRADAVYLAVLGAVFMGGAIVLDPLTAAAWQGNNAGRLFGDVRADSLTRRQAQLDQLRAERQAAEAEARLAARAAAAAREGSGAAHPQQADSAERGPAQPIVS